MLHEAANHTDVIFLNASEDESKGYGPLHSTLLWLECASTAWPKSKVVGKAEDDVWVHLPDIAASVQMAYADLMRRGIDLMYWGVMERYHIDTNTWRPTGFGYRGYDHSICRDPQENKTISGPFPYAKGAIYFLSTALAVELLKEEQRSRTGTLALSTADKRLGPSRSTAVYEDVYLGYAVAHLPATLRPYALVNFGSTMYVESWGLYSSPASIIWHAKLKDPNRLKLISQWKASEHCSRAAQNISIKCGSNGTSCRGSRYLRCFDPSPQSCPITTVDLKTALGFRGQVNNAQILNASQKG